MQWGQCNGNANAKARESRPSRLALSDNLIRNRDDLLSPVSGWIENTAYEKVKGLNNLFVS